ncbi:MAG: DinB family protein [Acidobacteria bacterium]|nr:DinB family protein [Acidobacteriota bacterium]
MLRRTRWFDRQFPPIEDNGLLPAILERLDGTAPRLRALLSGVDRAGPAASGWSIAQEVGHLIDLEPLWLTRAHDIMLGKPVLTTADLSNRATHEGDHDQWPVAQLVERFEHKRRSLVSALRAASDGDLERSAQHPRLGTPMRLIDLAYFVAEHDDHHLARLRELTITHGTHSQQL